MRSMHISLREFASHGRRLTAIQQRHTVAAPGYGRRSWNVSSGRGAPPFRLTVRRQDRREQVREQPGLSRGQGDVHARELVGDRPGLS
jgi:hypothetical protein